MWGRSGAAKPRRPPTPSHGTQPTAAALSGWRDQFLAARFDGSGQPNPVYTEAYGQLDLNIGYQWNENLSLSLEAINLNDAVQRQHGRHPNQVIFATQTGPRYMLGLRYKFW